MKKLKVLDLFSGIGGFSLGLERTGGFETVAFCEIDEWCQSQLKKNFPNVPVYNDVRTFNYEGTIDVITGGFPCQDISTAGEQAGIDSGERSSLWYEMLRLIGDLRPKYAIIENVPNLLTGERGAWFSRILSGLASIRYDAEWGSFSGHDLKASHERERVYILAYPSSFGQSKPRRLVNALYPTPDAFREADSFVSSFQGQYMPFVCGRHPRFSAGMVEVGMKALGNSIFPQIAEQHGLAILRAEAQP